MERAFAGVQGGAQRDVPIVDTPLVQHHVESLVAAGITEIIVVVREGGDIVQRHFRAQIRTWSSTWNAAASRSSWNRCARLSRLADMVLVRQPEDLPYGNASPALAARPWLTAGEPFYYMFGDDIIMADVPVPRQMLAAYRKFQPAAVVATQQVDDEETHLYGCIELKPARIVTWPASSRNPSPARRRRTGCRRATLSLRRRSLTCCRAPKWAKAGELWLADAVGRLARRSRVIVQPIEGLWMAAGDPLRHLKANIEVTLRRLTCATSWWPICARSSCEHGDAALVETYSGHTYAQEPRAIVWQGQRWRWPAWSGAGGRLRARPSACHRVRGVDSCCVSGKRGSWTIEASPANHCRRAERPLQTIPRVRFARALREPPG
jgi:UTP--glucose-1-phosphate uridylyltransferase